MRDLTENRPFIPAAGYGFALPLYDPLTRFLGVDTLRNEVVERAGLSPGQRVLDIGCGTGTLVIAAKRACPSAEIVGVDPDPNALERARRKAKRAKLDVRFERGYGDALPFDDASFAHVFSSFMLHHLPPDTQQELLAEARRVLASGGAFHLVDLAHGSGGHEHRGPFRFLRHAGPQPHLQTEPIVLNMLERAGFTDIMQHAERRLIFSPVLSVVARVPR